MPPEIDELFQNFKREISYYKTSTLENVLRYRVWHNGAVLLRWREDMIRRELSYRDYESQKTYGK